MDVRALALLAAALALAAPAPPALVAEGAGYLVAHQQADGGFAEPGGQSDPSLTAWAVLGLAAAGRPPGEEAARYLADKPYPKATDLELRILALRALGRDVTSLADELERLLQSDGRIGPFVNSTIWGIIALRAAGRPAGENVVGYLLRVQKRSGGWSWHPDVAADTDDTAAAIQALRAAGVQASSPGVRRGLAYLRRAQNRDGGFGSEPGRPSNTQTTAWAVQAFLAAGRDPGRAAFAYLERLRRPDGSFRYSARYAIAPVWVTSYVLAALARKPYPLGS